MAQQTPLSWSELQQYNKNPPEKALPRKKGIATRYGYYIKKLKQNNMTIDGHIMKQVFEHCDNDRIVITMNKFPYNVTDDITHLVAWINPLYTTSDEDVYKFLDETGVDYVAYVNKPAHISVESVRHFQLFIKNKDLSKFDVKSFADPWG